MNNAHREENIMTKKLSSLLILFFFIFSTTIGIAAAKDINKSFHESFDVKEGDTLRLKHGDGNVRLTPWDKDIIDVKVRYRADIDAVGIRLGSKDDFNVEFRQSGNTVYVTGRETSRGTIGFYNKKQYEYVYEILSPDYIRLDLDGDDGNVDISGWAAEIDCRIDDGDITFQNIRGDKTTIRGEDGDIEIDDLKGELAIEVDDGDVFLTACEMIRCRLEAEDGDFTINESQGSFDITVDDGNINTRQIAANGLIIRSEDGDIDLDLLATRMLDADIRTDDGDVTIDLEKGFSFSFHISADDVDYIRIDLDDIQNYHEDEHSKSGRIGGGNGRLKIRTADGDITIRENL
jgi:type 1 fimbria pilin